jgi:hypothetical protein
MVNKSQSDSGVDNGDAETNVAGDRKFCTTTTSGFYAPLSRLDSNMALFSE